jgi:t-SNARE complex subunit (syntaxin)
VINIANDSQGASQQLSQAHEYQRKSGKRLLCLLLIFIIVLAIVLIAVRRPTWRCLDPTGTH